MMTRFRCSLIHLLGLYLILSEGPGRFCFNAVWQLPRPYITLQADTYTQSLVVSWLVNHSGIVNDVHEIQITRTENHTFIYSKNISIPSGNSQGYRWTWTSDLPLNCVDHSVRIRHFYNQSVPSPWSKWVTNNGHRATDKVKIFPVEQVLRVGSTATFCCIPPRGVDITSITFNNQNYHLISVGGGVKAITVPNLTIPKRVIKLLVVSCHDTRGQTGSIVNYISSPLQKPKNISCETSCMKNVTCTWSQGDRDEVDHNKQTHTLHIVNSDQVLINISCKSLPCTFAAIPKLEQYNIRLVVRDQLGGEMEVESYSFNISERVFPVVEWDRVHPGVVDTTVSWIVRGNLTAHLNLLCQVAVDPGSTTELNCNSVSGLCKAKLEHLLPNTAYSTRVRCSVSGRRWGSWTKLMSFKTYPLVALNLWRKLKQLSNPHSRQVTLMWMLNTPDPANTKTVQEYTIQWSEDGQLKTEWRDGAQTQAEVSIGPGQYVFAVQAVLRTLPSVTANITIPKLEDKDILQLQKQLSTNIAGGFNLSWPEQDTATCGYTVEWCILGNAVPCTLQWIKMQKGHSTLSLPASNFKAGSRYTFNIYECTENGDTLLEIQTGYSQELEAQQPPSLVEPVHRTSSSVTLEWRYNENDPAHPAFITGYLVTVQEVGSNTPPGYFASLFVTDPQRKSVTLEGLKQSHEYSLSVSALTKAGPGQPTTITIRTNANYSIHLAKILTPILLLLGCTILLWPHIKLLREIFIYPAGMNIKTLEMENFLQEAGERLQSQQVEACLTCDIEILNPCQPLNEATTPGDPERLSTLPSPGSQPCASSVSPSCLTPHGYFPQSPSVTPARGRPLRNYEASKTRATFTPLSVSHRTSHSVTPLIVCRNRVKLCMVTSPMTFRKVKD